MLGDENKEKDSWRQLISGFGITPGCRRTDHNKNRTDREELNITDIL